MPTVTLANINTKNHHQGKVYTACVTCIGRGNNLDIFTPTRELVYGHKRAAGDARFQSYKPLTDQEYIQGYAALLKTRGAAIRAWIDALNEDVTVCCFCREGAFCHRRLLALWLPSYRPDLQIVLH